MPEIQPVRIVKEYNVELHMMGESVAVRWNRTAEETFCQDGDREFKGYEYVRKGNPYISFVWLQIDQNDGTVYIDDGSPVDGGIDASFAKTLIAEMQLAIQYIEQVTK